MNGARSIGKRFAARAVRVWIALAIAAHAAAADPSTAVPPLPRVVTAPTGWLPAADTVLGSASLDHRGAGAVVVSYGIGGLASLELGADSDLRECAMCAPAAPHAVLEPHAAFRIGARGVALVVQTGFGDSRASSATLAASRVVGPLRLHAAIEALDARVGNTRLGTTVRPLGGIELTPPQYPKTTLLGDLAWEPRFDATAPALEWLAGWGVRYQALRWGSIELDVRHREGEGLGGSTVLVRVNGVVGL